MQALLHASVARNRKLTVDWVPAEDLEDVTSEQVITDLSSVVYMLSFWFYFMPTL